MVSTAWHAISFVKKVGKAAGADGYRLGYRECASNDLSHDRIFNGNGGIAESEQDSFYPDRICIMALDFVSGNDLNLGKECEDVRFPWLTDENGAADECALFFCW